MKFLIWDLPTRLFHWLFAGSVVMAFALAELAEKETPLFYMHVVFAVLAALLLIWRLLWGIIGSKHSKWSQLFFTPGSIVEYFKSVLSGRGIYHAGHNPGGATVVLGIMGLVALTIVSGLLITQSEFFEEVHESLPIVTMVLVAFHVVGVLLATRMNNENYALSMITGRRRATEPESISSAHPVAAVFMLALVLGGWFYFIKGFDRNKALFTAPGTSWTFQVGEPEDEGEGNENEGDAQSQGPEGENAGADDDDDGDDD
jgi:cytochrome b